MPNFSHTSLIKLKKIKDFKYQFDANVEILVKIAFFSQHIYWNAQKFGLHVLAYFRPSPNQVYGIRGGQMLYCPTNALKYIKPLNC